MLLMRGLWKAEGLVDTQLMLVMTWAQRLLKPAQPADHQAAEWVNLMLNFAGRFDMTSPASRNTLHRPSPEAPK